MNRIIVGVMISLGILFMLPAALSYPYNDTLANDYGGLVLTSSKEFYGWDAYGNYQVHVELENKTGRNFTDIAFEVFYARNYSDYFTLIGIEKEVQLIESVVIGSSSIDCKDVVEIPQDKNGFIDYFCSESQTYCESSERCTYKEPIMGNRTVSRWTPFFRLSVLSRDITEIFKQDYVDGFQGGFIANNSKERFRLTISPSQKFLKEEYPIEFSVIAYSISNPSFKTILDPESGAFHQIEDFEDNWSNWVVEGASDGLTAIQESSIVNEGSSSIEFGIDVDSSGANEAGWAADGTIGSFDVSDTFGTSSGAPLAGTITLSCYTTSKDNISLMNIHIGSSTINVARYSVLIQCGLNDWNAMILPATSYYNIANTPDWTDLSYVRFETQYDGGANDFTIYLDDFYVGEKIVNLSPDVNLADFNTAGINFKGGSATTIFWSVSDGDSDSLLMDINFSKIREDGSGTSIVEDLNSDTACTQPVGADKKFCSFDWTNISSEDDNFFLNILVTDSTGETDFNSSDFNFQIDSTAPIFGDINKTFDVNSSTHILNEILYTVQDSASDVNFNGSPDIQLWVQVSHEDRDQNVWKSVRDQNFSGFQLADFEFSQIAKNGTIYDINLGNIEDSEYYFTHGNTDKNNFRDVDKSTINICASTIATISFVNTHVDNNVIYEFEFDANFDSPNPVGSLDIFDCNSTYVSGDPTLSDSCLQVGAITAATQTRPDGDYFITFRTDDDTIINGHQTTPDRNFVFVADTPCVKPWQLEFVPSPDTETFWQSTDDGVTWNLQTGTVESELHWFPEDQNSFFHFKIATIDGVGNDTNSILQSDLIDILNLPPSIAIQNPDLNESLMGTMDFSGFCADPNIEDDLNIALSINNHPANDLNTVLIETLKCVDLNFTFTFDTTTLPDGTYFLDVNIIDPSGESASDNHLFFIAQNVAPSIAVNFPSTGNMFNQNDISTIDINFTITDPDSSSFIVDVNFSTTNSQGTGTEIINDQNTDTSGSITCTGAAATGLECIVSLNIDSIADGNYFILVDAIDSEDSTFQAGDDFNIFTPARPTGDDCDIQFESDFLLGQYLMFTVSGFDADGSSLNFVNYDLWNGNEQLIDDANATAKGDFFEKVFDKKFNNDTFTLSIDAGGCILTKLCNNLKGRCE